MDPQGALLAMTRTVVAGQAILLINLESGTEMACQVQSVIPDESGLNYVEIQFPKVSRKFWRVPLAADGFDAVERESKQASAPATAPETEVVTNSEATEILEGQEKTAELPEKPNAEPLFEPEPHDLSDSDAASTGQATETAKNDASPENSGLNIPAARRPARRSPRVRMEIPVLVRLPGDSSVLYQRACICGCRTPGPHSTGSWRNP